MYSFQNFIVRIIPSHPPPLETRIWKLVVRVLVASSISVGDIFIYSCSAQLISFEIESKEINCAEHEYMNMPSLTYRAAVAIVFKINI